MGITTQYLRYVPGSVFGLVGTSRCAQFVTRFSQTAKYIAVPACELVFIWDTRRGVKVLTLDAEVNGNVNTVKPRPPTPGSLDNTHIAAGYTDGTVAIFDVHHGTPLKLVGHRGGVASLGWDAQGMRVASGSDDGEIVVWDVVSERGIVRLKGHKGKITQVCFMESRNILVSSSKDSFIKFWDLDTNHCFKTLTGHRAEVWDFALLKNDTRIISGSSDAELRVWALNFMDKSTVDKSEEKDKHEDIDEPPAKKFFIDTEGTSIPGNREEEEANDNSILEVKKLGSVLRSRGDRVCGLHTDGRIVAAHGKGPIVDLFMVLTDEEIEAKVAKRLKKSRKKARDSGSTETVVENATLADELRKLPSQRATNKIAAIDIFSDRGGSVKLGALHIDNSLCLYPSSLNDSAQNQNSKDKSQAKENQVNLVDRPGHRSEVRAIGFTSLSDQVVSASADSLKVWQRGQVECITTVPCDYALCLIVVPGDRHALVGTRSGCLQLFDLGSATLLEDIMAHEPDESATDTGIWSLALTHDSRGFITGGSDKMVKFWKFELVKDESRGGQGKRLSFFQDSRALKVADQVTCVRCSSNGRFISVATLDMKETLYFTDTLKLCHELYGKSLPSTCMDFSTDGTIIATGSKDANIRIYGTDFGDLRRLLKNAHQGGVTDLRFVAKTHLMFSCGQDGFVKQWDADNFQRIVNLRGHFGIVRCLAVCPKGAWVVSGGQDHSLRLWERTQEPLVLEEEREDERKAQEEDDGTALTTQRPIVAGEDGAQAVRPSLTTHHTEKAADMLMEALAIYREQIEGGADVKPHYLMEFVYNTTDPLKFFLHVLRRVKSSELEEAVLVLGLHQILELLLIVRELLTKGWDVELSNRVMLAAIRVNLPQLLSSPIAAPVIHSLAALVSKRNRELQDLMGFNLAGLKHLRNREEERTQTQLFVEATQKVKENRRKRKKKEQAVDRVMMAI